LLQTAQTKRFKSAGCKINPCADTDTGASKFSEISYSRRLVIFLSFFIFFFFFLPYSDRFYTLIAGVEVTARDHTQ
jgi:hypothetical protein